MIMLKIRQSQLNLASLTYVLVKAFRVVVVGRGERVGPHMESISTPLLKGGSQPGNSLLKLKTETYICSEPTTVGEEHLSIKKM